MKNLRFFNNMNIRRKMLFIYLVAILLPFLTAGWLYIRQTNRAIEAQTLDAIRSRTLQYTQSLNGRLFNYTMLANLIANNSDFMRELERPYRNVLDALEVYQKIWNQYRSHKSTWPYLKNITIYSSNPTLRNSFPYLVRNDTYMENMKVYKEILLYGNAGCWYGLRSVNSMEYWQPANEIAAARRFQTFTYNRTLYSAERLAAPIGILTIEIQKEAITELIETAGDMSVLLLDSNSSRVVASGDPWSTIDTGILEEFLIQSSKSPTVLLDGSRYYAEQTRLDNGWQLLLAIPFEKAFANTIAIRNYGILLIVSVSCLIVLLIFLFSRLISKRYRTLLDKMKHFMNGDMQLGDPLGGKDEIGLLDKEFSSMAQELKKRIDQTYVLQLQKNQFRLQTLQTQINPHFLYNTLSTIAWLSDNNPREEIRAAVENLASFYRQTLSKGKDIVTLESEMLGVQAYIQLQKIRYDQRINVYYDVEELACSTLIPNVTIQPLVENSICHGLFGERDQLTILISAHITGDKVEIKVQDDGVGMSADTLAKLLEGEVVSKKGSGLGFRNINDRIKLYFGETYGLDACSEPATGTTVIIRLPFCTTMEETPYNDEK